MRGQAFRTRMPLPPHPAAATFSPAGRRQPTVTSNISRTLHTSVIPTHFWFSHLWQLSGATCPAQAVFKAIRAGTASVFSPNSYDPEM
ncbi:hypothetical protein DSM25558_1610 [Agrobacterium sp. DSM 25558]|nr:hypothetical protein DSM25558_1610 [Agrobacterium sp. DSM 25558]